MSDFEDEPQFDENGAGQDQLPEGAEPRSALEASIFSKGRNSYYYAHSKKLDAPDWDGNQEPRLLARETLEGVAVPPEQIQTFAWSDEKEKIKVYVTMAELEALPEEQVVLEWSDTSMTLIVKVDSGKDHVLWIKKLYDEIEDASFRKRKDKIIVTLKKKEGKTHTWFDIRKAI